MPIREIQAANDMVGDSDGLSKADTALISPVELGSAETTGIFLLGHCFHLQCLASERSGDKTCGSSELVGRSKPSVNPEC